MSKNVSDSTFSNCESETVGSDSEYYSSSDEEEDSIEVNEITVKIDNIPYELDTEKVLGLFGNDLKIEFKRKCKLSKANKKTKTRSIAVIVPDHETLSEVVRRGNQMKLGKKYLQVFDYNGTCDHDDFIYVFQINTRSEEMIRRHFSQYGDILSVFQKDECSAKIQFYSKEQKDNALRDKDSLFNGEKIIVQDTPIIYPKESVALFILSIPPIITEDHIVNTLSSFVHPISISLHYEKRTCIITFKDTKDLITTTKYLLTHYIEKQYLMFSVFGKKLLDDMKLKNELRQRMIDAGIKTNKTDSIIKRLTPYQISFLVKDRNTSNQFIELHNTE